ncbi:glycoprotein hormones alpha chain-like [Sardina pilchardus]|uniref:glycoprotein hormones alpha chain-like n=1 Tax=Sardina pilchardus TaxID=27697 RepID=UPI002E10FE00
MVTQTESCIASLLLVSILVHIGDVHTNSFMASEGCEECKLAKHDIFAGLYQCKGCCYSGAYPTDLDFNKPPVQRKINSEASCCVAREFDSVTPYIRADKGQLQNHTSCHCSTCEYHKTTTSK